VTVSGDLLVNTTYSRAVSFLNESVTPVDDITVEVKEEGLEHQLFFRLRKQLSLYLCDADGNGKTNWIGFYFKKVQQLQLAV
jgi:putative methionine-R-sulfoxide reductase with GAF domain